MSPLELAAVGRNLTLVHPTSQATCLTLAASKCRSHNLCLQTVSTIWVPLAQKAENSKNTLSGSKLSSQDTKSREKENIQFYWWSVAVCPRECWSGENYKNTGLWGQFTQEAYRVYAWFYPVILLMITQQHKNSRKRWNKWFDYTKDDQKVKINNKTWVPTWE